MRKLRRLLFSALLLATFFTPVVIIEGAPIAHAAACDTSFNGTNSQEWNDAGNWSGGLPDATKNACIDGAIISSDVNIEIGENMAAKSLTMTNGGNIVSGGHLTLSNASTLTSFAQGSSATLTVNGATTIHTLNTTGGSFNGNGSITLTAGGTSTFGNGGTYPYVFGVPLTLDGTISWVSADIYATRPFTIEGNGSFLPVGGNTGLLSALSISVTGNGVFAAEDTEVTTVNGLTLSTPGGGMTVGNGNIHSAVMQHAGYINWDAASLSTETFSGDWTQDGGKFMPRLSASSSDKIVLDSGATYSAVGTATIAPQSQSGFLGADGHSANVVSGSDTSGSYYGIDMSPFHGLLSTIDYTHGVTLNMHTQGPQTRGTGYWMMGSDGHLYAFGDAASLSLPSVDAPTVSMAINPTNSGYWAVDTAGKVYAKGTSTSFGDTSNLTLNKPIVNIASTPDGNGYWVLAKDGGVFAFGDAQFYGSASGVSRADVVALVATPSGRGYWIIASDGGVFCFGDAQFHGSMGGHSLNSPVVGAAASHDGFGYYLVAADGGIFCFGDAQFYGSASGLASAPIVQ